MQGFRKIDDLNKLAKLIRKLGAGSYGEVGLGRLKTSIIAPDGSTIPDGSLVAIKAQEMTDLALVMREIKALKYVMTAKCNNVNKIYDVWFDPAKKRLYFVMEYIKGESLKDYAESDPKMQALHVAIANETVEALQQWIPTEDDLLSIVRPLYDALQCMHNHRLSHNDIKLENIMYDEPKKQPIWIDLGLSCIETCSSSPSGSPLTMAPEVMAPKLFGVDLSRFETRAKADMWSFGCTIYMFITEKIPELADEISEIFVDIYHHDDSNEEDNEHEQQLELELETKLKEVFANNKNVDIQLVPDIYPRIKAMLQGCLQVDPKDRSLKL